MKKILLTGPAGAGKTHTLLTQFRQTLAGLRDPLDRGCAYILPSAEHAERILTLMMQGGLEGFFHRRITTLTRLVSELFGPGKQGISTNVSRFLIVREILAAENWEYFKEIQDAPGFAHLLLGFIAELKESLVSAEFFRERVNAMKPLEPAFRAKYEALASIYERYEAALAARGSKDREDIVFENAQAARQVGQKQKPIFQKLWLDGFYDFSPLQFACLEGLCGLAEEVTITLTCEEDAGRDLFEAVLETREKLLSLGFQEERLAHRAGGKSRSTLAVLERGLFSTERSKARPAAGPALAVFEAVEMEGEIEMIARRIDRRVRAGDYRFSDFAILFREIGEYRPVLRSVFRRYVIPLEVHEREKLTFAPLIQVLVRLLAVFREGWRAADLLAFLKSGYIRRIGALDNSPEWVSRLENFSLRERIGSGRERWLRPLMPEEETKRGLWPGTLERLGRLAALEDELRQAPDFYALKRVFFDSLRGLFGILEKPEGPEDVSSLRRDAASLSRLLALMDEIEISLAGFIPQPDAAAAGTLFEAFGDRFLRLVELDLYSLHGGDRNCVQVFDVSLSRDKEFRVVFVAGLLEKKFPRELREDPLLSDWERRLFNGTPDGARLRERLIRQNMERYLFYLAATRATETLVLSYPRVDLEGREYLPSYYVEEALSLFQKDSAEIQRQELGRPFPRLADAVTLREMELAVLSGLSGAPGDDPQQVFAAATELCRTGKTRKRFEKAFFRVNARLEDPRIHQEDYFRAAITSASRLEEYGKCAFKYYAHQVLKLADPEEDSNVFVRGLILHQVLERLFKQAAQKPTLLKNLPVALEFARREMEIALHDYALIFDKSYQYDLEVENGWDILKALLEYELERLASSPLEPRYFELEFGEPETGYPALEIDAAGQTLKIRGKIDRVDVSRDGAAGLVMDYKRTQAFKSKDLVLGTQLQLAIYLLALEKFLGLKPVGGELYSLKKIQKGGFYRADLLELAGKKPSRGVLAFSEEDFKAVLERSLFFIRQYYAGMRDKIIRVRPRLCDEFCSYAPVCRVEKWRLPAVLEEIKEEDRQNAPPFPGREVLSGESAP